MRPYLTSGGAALVVFAAVLSAQAPSAPPPGSVRRVQDRIQALQREAEQLARDARTLVNELRRLEIERDLRAAEARAAADAAVQAQLALQQTTDRLAALESQRLAQLPDLRAQLVDLYKNGRSRYARLLLGAGHARAVGRTVRAISSLAALHQRQLDDYRRTLERLRRERAQLEQKAAELEARRAEARTAQEAADRAVRARAAFVAQLDARRDMAAQYAGELQVAYDRLQRQLLARSGTGGERVSIPLGPFRGALEWPVAGRVIGRFGQASNRLGGTATRNGVDISAPEGTPVRAVHGGTVAFAGGYAGFGTLVIVDHGADAFSLYGYLSEVGVERGAFVEAGDELGRVGTAPAGPAALYFELRVDGRSVDPVQWLRPQ